LNRSFEPRDSWERTLNDEARRLREQPVQSVVEREGSIVVRLAGELDLYNAPMIREALFAALESHPERLVIDLGEVAFVDSTALGVLLEARARLEPRESFVLAAPGAETRRTLQVSGLDRQIAVADSVEAALS
jgi:anti-sigma B factor antagonist